MSYCPRCGSNRGDLSWHDEAGRERDALAIENEAMRRDAERYRFLKSRIEVKNAIPIFLSLNEWHPQTFDMGIDESIDEAMK
jgi:NMD protein affecting ribosome stability and mRNA decay